MTRQRVATPDGFKLKLRTDVIYSALTTERIILRIRENPEEWSHWTKSLALSLHAIGQGAMTLELDKRASLHRGDIPEGARDCYNNKFFGLQKATKAWENAAGTSYEEKYASKLSDLNDLRNSLLHIGPTDAIPIEPTELIKMYRVCADAFLYIAFECSPIGWDEEQEQQIKHAIYAFKDHLSEIERIAPDLR